MPKSSRATDTPVRRRAPAMTPEAREDQMIACAIDLAERQLLEGTASSQVITHFLKLGSTREKREQEKLTKEIELLSAKSDEIRSSRQNEELYKNAINAMKIYGGNGRGDDDEDG